MLFQLTNLNVKCVEVGDKRVLSGIVEVLISLLGHRYHQERIKRTKKAKEKFLKLKEEDLLPP